MLRHIVANQVTTGMANPFSLNSIMTISNRNQAQRLHLVAVQEDLPLRARLLLGHHHQLLHQRQHRPTRTGLPTSRTDGNSRLLTSGTKGMRAKIWYFIS